MAAEIIIFFPHCKNISVLFCIGTLRPSNLGGNFSRDVTRIAGNNDEHNIITQKFRAFPPQSKKLDTIIEPFPGFPGTTTVPTTDKTVAMHGQPRNGSGDRFQGSFIFLVVHASFIGHNHHGQNRGYAWATAPRFGGPTPGIILYFPSPLHNFLTS